MTDLQALLSLNSTRDTRSVPIDCVERYLEFSKAIKPLEAAQDLNNRLILDRFDKKEVTAGDTRGAKSVGVALVDAIDGVHVAKGRAALQSFAELSDDIHSRVADHLRLTDAVLKRDKKATNFHATRSNKLTLLFAAIDPAKAYSAIDAMPIQDARALIGAIRKQAGKSTFLTRFEGIHSVKRSFIEIVVELKAMLADKLQDKAYVRKTCRDLFQGRPQLQNLMGNLMESRYGLVTQGQHGGSFFRRLSNFLIGVVWLLYVLVAAPLAPLVLAPVVACMMLTKPHRDDVSKTAKDQTKQANCLPRIFSWPVFALAAGVTELLFQVPKEYMYMPGKSTRQQREQQYLKLQIVRNFILFHFHNFGKRYPNKQAYEGALDRFLADRIPVTPEMLLLNWQ